MKAGNRREAFILILRTKGEKRRRNGLKLQLRTVNSALSETRTICPCPDDAKNKQTKKPFILKYLLTTGKKKIKKPAVIRRELKGQL